VSIEQYLNAWLTAEQATQSDAVSVFIDAVSVETTSRHVVPPGKQSPAGKAEQQLLISGEISVQNPQSISGSEPPWASVA
jgi:hypothetical protein